MKSTLPAFSNGSVTESSDPVVTDTYTQEEIDTKDANVLSEAKAYTDTAALGGSTPTAHTGTI